MTPEAPLIFALILIYLALQLVERGEDPVETSSTPREPGARQLPPEDSI